MTVDTRAFYRAFLKKLRYAMPPQNHPPMAQFVARAIDQMCPASGLSADCVGLEREGVQRTGSLVATELANIHGYLDRRELHDGWGRIPQRFTIENPPAPVHVAHFDTAAIEGCPELVYAATAPAILAPVVSYFGCLPTISYFALWWSLAGRVAPEDAELWHRDFHDYRWVKLFIPLTDVDEESGPTDIIKQSHHMAYWSAKWAEIQPGDGQRFTTMAQAQRKDDADVAHFFRPEEIETMTAKAGEGYLADTAAWHRGRLPRSRNRLMFQALYTLLPDPKVEPTPLKIPAFDAGWHGRYGDALSVEQLRFVTRLVVA